MKKYLFSLILIINLFSTNGWGQILSFEFASLVGNETTATSNSNDVNLTSSTISRGTGLTASSNSQRFNAKNWALSSIGNAVSGDKFMEFTITPILGYQFDVSSIYLQLQRSGTGPSALVLRSSVDNYVSNLDQEYEIEDITGTQNFTFTFSQPISTTPVTYRFYMYAESTGGSGGIGDGTGEDLIVYGSTSSTGSSPTITLSNPSFSSFTYNFGSGPSISQSFKINGTNLTNNISVAASTNYEISNDNSNFQSIPLTLIQTGGSVATTTIYIRLKSGLTVGNYNNDVITVSSTGASSKLVTCNGNVKGLQYASLPYSEDFNSCSSHKWNIQSITSDKDWSCESGNMSINGSGSSESSNDYLISPSFDLDSYKHSVLSFTSYTKYADAVYPSVQLLYSTDYIGDASTSTWTPITAKWSAENSETSTSSGEIDISSITGTNVCFAFCYTSTGAGTSAFWSIDDFSIKQNVADSNKIPNAWINEIHYDNSGSDLNEMVEIVIERADTLNLSDFTVSLYNGGDGKVYNTRSVSTFTAGEVNGDYSILYMIYPANGLQNGPDGISIDWKGILVQFLSYEGTFIGSAGPADGTTSINIRVSESSSKPVGQSLQLIGTGLQYSNFSWIDPIASPGSINSGQAFSIPLNPVPVDWRYILLTFVLMAGLIAYRRLK